MTPDTLMVSFTARVFTFTGADSSSALQATKFTVARAIKAAPTKPLKYFFIFQHFKLNNNITNSLFFFKAFKNIKVFKGFKEKNV
jgi:hypothetical protein